VCALFFEVTLGVGCKKLVSGVFYFKVNMQTEEEYREFLDILSNNYYGTVIELKEEGVNRLSGEDTNENAGKKES